MDEEFEKERFEKLGIKTSVAIRFREFCKKMSKSQSMTLMLMLDFFEENGISPSESLGPRMETLEARMAALIKKRMNGMIAILKDIEKSQTKPTAAMLYSLFEQAEPKKEKLILEKKFGKKIGEGIIVKEIVTMKPPGTNGKSKLNRSSECRL